MPPFGGESDCTLVQKRSCVSKRERGILLEASVCVNGDRCERTMCSGKGLELGW
jgi:hypothetical protein